MKNFLITIFLVGLLVWGVVLFFVSWTRHTAETFEDCVAQGNTVTTSTPPTCVAGGKTFFGPTSVGSANIHVFSPKENESVEYPLTIKGEARVFENTLNFRVLDGDGVVLAEGSAMAMSPDVGFFGLFEITPNYPEPKTSTGTVQVFDYSAKDGSQIDMVQIPVVFAPVEHETVNVFFSNRNQDPNFIECDTVYPTVRTVVKTSAIGLRALQELLKGPSVTERQQGFFTNLNNGIKLKSFNVAGGVAYADFDDQLGFRVGGSCRVGAIRAQITETLKQFPAVTSVVISINGRTADILQP